MRLLKHCRICATIIVGAKMLFAGVVVALAMALEHGCTHIDDKRTPPAPVRVAFPTEAEWRLYGTPAASDWQTFILTSKERQPANFPYTATSHTGFGGILLVCDVMGNPVAFDLACPVENRADVRIQMDAETNQAFCPKCRSRYEVLTNYGIALSGRAQELGYGLTRYAVGPGQNGEYRVIYR